MQPQELAPKLKTYWNELYPLSSDDGCTELINYLVKVKSENPLLPVQRNWHKNAIVYALYVDLFNDTFDGLTIRLDYLFSLGINCLWLLPVFESPMRDMGFDISDFYRIRSTLFSTGSEISENKTSGEFHRFIKEAKKRNMKVIFDVALNHVSTDHSWFKEAAGNPNSPFRDYFIWSSDGKQYSQAPVIFNHLADSNWEKCGEQYYFHRFFSFQADLNYHNPEVLIEISKVLAFWISRGIDGFRADAAPYLWKEEGTNCENLQQTHTILAFFRTVIDFMRPNTLFLAEACLPPDKTSAYFGTIDRPECNAAYHFTLIPQFYSAIAHENKQPLVDMMDITHRFILPPDSQWFVFLRCHDELNFEMLDHYQPVHQAFCHDRRWNFRNGAGISARLADLMDYDARKIGLAFSMLMSVTGTPIVFYGDEFAKLNDIEYFYRMSNYTGIRDTRYLARGHIDWRKVFHDLDDKKTLSHAVFQQLKKITGIRNRIDDFGSASFIPLPLFHPEGNEAVQVFAFKRVIKEQVYIFIHNLGSAPCQVDLPEEIPTSVDLLGKAVGNVLEPYAYHWIKV